ncbi:TPA: hypothetical protein ACLQU7_004811 [Bacillus tropicus]|uniref:hypothetical protein n=1 Tax=Bacillus cereus group TaxID=86661 RepID=UPI00003CB5B6|nr:MULTISPECIES: hypothetical protein [Bacillus cereus group]AIY72906.1 putative collagen-like protein [Bacillus cereus]AJI07933.1 putative collagen-like protein [Bacillus cereus G9241]EAL15953.1 collagen triple helix repeat protein, putative [Bacillus cereus G9241]QPS53440.1 hypothetical protein I6G54_28800 [Bacillus tropicus]
MGIGFNGVPVPSLDGANYGTAVGQEVVGFGFSGQVPAGTTVSLYNLNGQTVTIGGNTGSTSAAARLSFFRIS